MKSQLNISFNLVISIIIGIVVFIIVFNLGSSFFSISSEASSIRVYNHFDLLVRNLQSEANYARAVRLSKSYSFQFDGERILLKGLPQSIDARDSLVVLPKEFDSERLVFFSRRSSYPLSNTDYTYIVPDNRKFFIFDDQTGQDSEFSSEIFDFLPRRRVYNPVSGEEELMLDKYLVKMTDINAIITACRTIYPCYIIYVNKDPDFGLDNLNAKIFQIRGNPESGKAILHSTSEEFYYFSMESLMAAIVLSEKELYNAALRKINRTTAFNNLLNNNHFELLKSINPSDCEDFLEDAKDLSNKITQSFSDFYNNPDSSSVSDLKQKQEAYNQALLELDKNGCLR